MADIPSEKVVERRSAVALTILCGLMVLLIAALISLGIWQIERLSWKEDLIARVDQRARAEAVSAPNRSEWNEVSRAKDEYRHVAAEGILQNDKETLIYASTTLGAGYWVLTPLKLFDGTSILINRGFVPTDKRDPAARSEGQITAPLKITGLLRISEPKGTFIKSNDPTNDRWYSRDVAAIAERRGVDNAAPYFIDADATPNPGSLPVGGLTQVVFPNNHLVYAITWFALAIMTTGLLAFVVRIELRARRS